ncbi:hypothetical protein HYC85_011608 [Camellia sinensis]|uniref:Kinesin motor domain-containing protein n=1 Tax=Camellia sinensis TaxID=4442 RepID=A0A7J7HAG8_CAMSI|nr:hypothetical protein HYC85_011608 [Camellia sinensis]
MPQESNYNSIFNSPCKNLRGLKGLNSIINNNNNNNNSNSNGTDCSYGEEIINDHELAQRKAGEAASRRYQATEWLRQMDQGASEVLPKEPSEEHFCLALRNGLILCNVLNKVNPGAVHKVVEIPIIDVQATEGAAQSAIQYFENMRNFLVAVGNMKLLTFEASDLEKGGSSSKVVDCILCLKGYYEWKQAGGIGVWRYGGTVRITSLPKGSPSSLVGSESTDESLDESESSQYEQLLDFLHLSSVVSVEESKAANALTFLFDGFGLGLLQAYLSERNGIEDLPLNAMVIDTVLRKAVKDFSAQLVSEGIQLGLLLKKLLIGNGVPLSKTEFLEAISRYLDQKTSLASSDMSKYCICGGKREVIWRNISHSAGDLELLDLQQKQLEELKSRFQETKLEVKQVQAGWEEEHRRLGTIRVYCRVRPFLPGQSDGQSTVDYIGENGNIMIANPYKQGKDARRVFAFNKVFATNVTQQQIYADTQPLVRSVLDGYNVCIFAYGQTGSGKTYTMSGPDLNMEDTWGVNYRALRDLFEISKARVDFIEYEVGVQMIEIYNEQVRDLLVIDGSNRRYPFRIYFYIRNNSQLNGLNVPDACLVPVKCTQDVLDLMKIGQKNRAVGATALNERSSRSHSVLTVHVRGKELLSGSILKGCLHLVDLAGSERVDKSEAVGERLKEAQHINRSLSALGDVISALAQKSTHIPYRNSKLTQVLQDSLGGHAKTLMFVHINPEVNSIGETISTLKFAERVASIELGAARSNKETGEIRDLKEEISNIKLALERKEAELEQLKSGSARGTIESQRTRAVSPMHIPKCGISASLKPDISQRPIDDTRISEARKQRRSRLPSKFSDKDVIPKMPFLTEERLVNNSSKPRSPSPPVRRSMSTDRGALIKSRVKPETTDNLPITKLHFPTRVSVNKSVATMPVIPSIESNGGGFLAPRDVPKQENISDAFFSFQRAISKKIHPEHEEEQFKQALNVRQGGIRKSKPEMTSPEPENEQGLVVSPVLSTLRVKKLQRNPSRSNVEPRELVQTVETFLSGKNEQRVSNGVFRYPKEPSNSAMPAAMPEFRRSRSTPRGKFMVLP